jgi:hypothetical protein
MKVNLNKQFKTLTGAEIAGETYADLISKALFNGHGISSTPDEKYAAYKLSTKIIATDGQIEATEAEVALIKTVAAATLTPGAYGQLIDSLNTELSIKN